MQGSSVGGETYDEVLKQAPELWAVHDEYVSQLATGVSEDEAKQNIANTLARGAAFDSAAISVLVNLLPGAKSLEKLITKAGSEGKKGLVNRLIAGGKGALGEGTAEAIEEGSGALLTNKAVQNIDPNQDLMEGVAEATGTGAAAALMGGPAGLITSGASNDDQAPQADLDNDPTTGDPNDPSTWGLSTKSTQDIEAERAADDEVPVGTPQDEVDLFDGLGVMTEEQTETAIDIESNTPAPGSIPDTSGLDLLAPGETEPTAPVPRPFQEPEPELGIVPELEEAGAQISPSQQPNQMPNVPDFGLQDPNAPRGGPVDQDGIEFSPPTDDSLSLAPAEPGIQGPSPEPAALPETPGLELAPDPLGLMTPEDYTRARDKQNKEREDAIATAGVVPANDATPETKQKTPTDSGVDNNEDVKQPVSIGKNPELGKQEVQPVTTGKAKPQQDGNETGGEKQKASASAKGEAEAIGSVRDKDQEKPEKRPGKLRNGSVADKSGKESPDTSADDIRAAGAETNTAPTEGQKDKGNYKKGRVKVLGNEIAIENPKGSVRSGTDPNGKSWKSTLKSHYGYVVGTLGADGDALDVFVNDTDIKPDAPVFIVDQIDAKGGFDEHKIMVGFKSKVAARAGYLSNYSKGWKTGAISQLTAEEFAAWLKESDTTKPFAQPKPKAIDASVVGSNILEQTKPVYLRGMAKKVGLKKGSPGYQDAFDKLSDQYEDLLDFAMAELPFDEYNERNPESSEGINRQAWISLREDLGIGKVSAKVGEPGHKSSTGKSLQSVASEINEQINGSDSNSKATNSQVTDTDRVEESSKSTRAKNKTQDDDRGIGDAAFGHELSNSGRTTERAYSSSITGDRDRATVNNMDRISEGFGEKVGGARKDLPLKTASKKTDVNDKALTEKNSASDAGESFHRVRSRKSGSSKKLGVSVASLTRFVSGINSEIPIHVVETVGDLPTTEPHDTEGAYYGDSVFLVRENLPSITAARIVLAHELVGHHGIENIPGVDFGSIGAAITKLEKSGNKAITEAASKVDASEPDASSLLRTKEIMARLSEARVTEDSVKALFRKVREAVRKFIRSLGITGLMPQTDLDAIVTEAMLSSTNQKNEPISALHSLSPMKSVTANIARGREALAKALNEKTSVHRAMYRNDTGWIDFVWGDTGKLPDRKGRRKGAKGLAHIVEARMRKDGYSEAEAIKLLDHIVEVIASGSILRESKTGKSTQRVLKYNEYEAVLAKANGSNAWMVTGWKTFDAPEVGNGSPGATHSQADPTDLREGANESSPGTVRSLSRPGEGSDSVSATPSSLPETDKPSSESDLSDPLDGTIDQQVDADNKPLRSRRVDSVTKPHGNKINPYDKLPPEIRHRLKTARNKVARWTRKNLTKEGLLNTEGFELKIKNDAAKNVGEAEVANVLADFTQMTKKHFGEWFYHGVDKAELARMNDYLGGEEVAVPEAMKNGLDMLRDHLDNLSGEMTNSYKEILQLKVDALTDDQRGDYYAALDSNGGSGRIPAEIQPILDMIETITGNIGSYLNRSYQAFDDKGWREKVERNEDLMSRAMDYIRELNPDLSEVEVEGAVYAILNDAHAKGNFQSLVSKGSKVGSKDVSFLKKRKDVPPIVRELLGEYKDPRVNFAKSASKMHWYLANHKFLMSFREAGLDTFIFDKPTGKEFATRIASKGSNTMNPLDGLYTSEDLAEGMEDMNGRIESSALMQKIIAANSMVKYGKAQPLDAMVYTPTGPVTMGSLAARDIVLSVNGPSVIKEIFPQGEMEVYRVTFSDGSSTEATGNHLWQVDGPQGQKSRNGVFTTDELMSWPDKVIRSTSVPLSAAEFDGQDVPVDPYLLGVLLGDGSFRGTNTVKLSTPDAEIVEMFRQGLPDDCMIHQPPSFAEYDYTIKTKASNHDTTSLFKAIGKLGLWGKKSYDKFIPDIYRYNSREVRLEIVRGLLDTDGWVVRDGQPCFSTSSKQLADDMKEVAESLGATLLPRQKMTTSGRWSYELKFRVDNAPDWFHLTRQKEKATSRAKPVRRMFRSFELVGKKPCQCILIDDPSHLYLTDNFIVTHNTILSPTTQVRNFISAALFTVSNGHINYWKPVSKAFNVGKSDLFRRNKEWRTYQLRLIELGVMHDNPYAGEMRDAIDDFMNMDTYGKGLIGTGKKILDFTQRTYQFSDDFWKIIGFENELGLLMESGMPQTEAEVMAARRIRDGYPTYSMVPLGIKHIRRWPLIGSFVSFPWEIMRTTKNQIGFIQEDWGVRQKQANLRILGLATTSALTATVSYLSMVWAGLDSEDDEAIRAQLPEWSQNSQLLYLGKDEAGEPRYIDLSFIDPYTYIKKPISALLNGNHDRVSDRLLDSAKEILDPFFGPDIAASALGEILYNQTAWGGEIYNSQDSALSQVSDILHHLRKAVQPGFMSNIEKTLKAINEESSRSGKKFVLRDEIWAIAGVRMGTFNLRQSMIYKGFSFGDEMRDATKVLSRKIGDQSSVSDDDLVAVVDSMQRARKDSFKRMIKLLNGARKLGLTEEDIFRSLRAANISKKNIRALMYGEYLPWQMSRRFAVSATRRAQASTGSLRERLQIGREMEKRKRLVFQLVAGSSQ